MTIIKPNSIAGITSITAQGDVINVYKSDGTLAGLQLNGVNFNTTSGVSTFNNVTVGGTITYQDVSHVDSVGIITAQQGLQVLANGLDVTGVSTFNSNVGIGTDNPTAPLAVMNSSDPEIRFGYNETQDHRLTWDGSKVFLEADPENANGSSALGFKVDGTERLRINSSGLVGIGTDSPSRRLHVNSGSTDTAALFYSSDAGVYINFQDSTSAASGVTIGGTGDDLRFGSGGGGEFLRITSTGDFVVSAGATFGSSAGVVTYFGDGSNLTGIAAGGSGTFDTGISTSVIVPVTAGIGTNDDTNRDIFVGPGIAYSFPSTASTQYVIESIHVVNKSGGNLYVSGRHDINGGANVPLANRVIVPYNGAVELLEEPHVANLSDIIRLQALTGTGTSATGANNGLDAFITYSKPVFS